MKKLVIAAVLLLIGTAAEARIYHVEGATIRIQDGCRSARCVAVDAPGYGTYDGISGRGGPFLKVQKLQKDQSRFTMTAQADKVAAPAPDETSAKPQTASTPATPSDVTPAK